MEWTDKTGRHWHATSEESLLVVENTDDGGGWHASPMSVSGHALYTQLVKVAAQCAAIAVTAKRQRIELRELIGREALEQRDLDRLESLERGDLDGQAHSIHDLDKRVQALETWRLAGAADGDACPACDLIDRERPATVHGR